MRAVVPCLLFGLAAAFMSGIQVHHAKLWFAGEAGNWGLSDFETKEIRETIDDIRNCHRATKHEFNVICIPTAPPITNQVFRNQ